MSSNDYKNPMFNNEATQDKNTKSEPSKTQNISEKLPRGGTGNMHMQAEIVDQVNANQQSNMTLSAYSVITQSYSTVKINQS